jgi:hypothetical protein
VEGYAQNTFITVDGCRTHDPTVSDQAHHGFKFIRQCSCSLRSQYFDISNFSSRMQCSPPCTISSLITYRDTKKLVYVFLCHFEPKWYVFLGLCVSIGFGAVHNTFCFPSRAGISGGEKDDVDVRGELDVEFEPPDIPTSKISRTASAWGSLARKRCAVSRSPGKCGESKT